MKSYIPYSCEIERYEESKQISSPVQEKAQMNFIKDTKGSTWDKYVGMTCRKILYQSSCFQNMLGHPRTGHRPMGNHQGHTFPFWLQVCHDMERHRNVLFRLLGQHSGIFCMVFLVGFAKAKEWGRRCSVSWSVPGYYWGKEQGKELGLCMAKAPLCKWLQTIFSMPILLKGGLNMRLFTPSAERMTLSSCWLRHWELSF